MKPCNHLLGYFDVGHYDYSETNFLYSDFYDISDGESVLKESGAFKFCPNCGESLDGKIERRISELKKIKEDMKKEKEREKAIQQQKFEKFKIEMGKKSKLSNLPDEGSFIIIIEKIREWGKNACIYGTKQTILNSFASYAKNNTRESLNILKIYKTPPQKEMVDFMNSCGFLTEFKTMDFLGGKTLLCCQKTVDENKRIRVQFDETNSFAYIDTITKDEDGEEYTAYTQILSHNLGEYLGVKLELEEVII